MDRNTHNTNSHNAKHNGVILAIIRYAKTVKSHTYCRNKETIYLPAHAILSPDDPMYALMKGQDPTTEYAPVC